MTGRKISETQEARPARSRNNTESMQAEQRAQLYAEIIKGMPVGLNVWCLEDASDLGSFRLVLSNPAAAQFTGVPREDVLGKNVAESYPAALEMETLRAFAEVIRSGKARDLGEFRYSDERIPEAVFAMTAFPLPNNCVGVAFENVIQRKRAEEALRESEQRYRLLAENVTDVIWTADMDLNLTYISPSDQRLRSYPPQERIGLTAKEALTPTSLEAAKAALAEELGIECREQKDLTRSRTMEVEVYRKDGSTVWAEMKMTFLRDPDGRPVGILGVTRDITERKQAEEALRESERRFRTLSEASFEAIAIHRKGRMLEGNQALAAMFGHELSEVIGMHVLDFVAPESRDAVLQSILSKSREPFEFTGLRKDGSTFPVEVCGRPIPYQGKMVTVAALRDITEHKRAEEALQEAREELEARVERQMQRGNPYGLTFRELTVLHLVAAGKADKEIGRELGISPLTAHKHLANILDKMGAASRTEASVRALREGLLD